MDEERILNIILDWLCEQTRLLVKATEKADALEANLQKAREDVEYWKAAYFKAKEAKDDTDGA